MKMKMNIKTGIEIDNDEWADGRRVAISDGDAAGIDLELLEDSAIREAVLQKLFRDFESRLRAALERFEREAAEKMDATNAPETPGEAG